MELALIIELIMEQVTIWAPSLVAVLGVITATVTNGNKTRKGLDEIRATTEGLKQNKVIKDLTNEVKSLITENNRLMKQQQMILDKLAMVKNYRIEETEDEVE